MGTLCLRIEFLPKGKSLGLFVIDGHRLDEQFSGQLDFVAIITKDFDQHITCVNWLSEAFVHD
jgi:hypothetical protein